MFNREPIILLAFFLIAVKYFPAQFADPISPILKFLNEGRLNGESEPPDRQKVLKEYDFIIIGAGTAGATLANRLTEVPHWKVLLIEAGGNENYIMDIPLLVNYLQFTEANWKYKTMPTPNGCLGFDKQQCHWPRGKVMGGSSVLNYMIYTRGNRRDYDNWLRMGNEGWGWDDVFPYFKKIENFQIPEFDNQKYHGNDGYLQIEQAPFRTKAASAWVKAAQEAGHKYVDYNGETQTGVSFFQLSMQNGTRHSSNRAYLHPVSRRPNLHVVKRSLATKILIDKGTNRAVGVEFERNNRRYRVTARREVVVSAGTINSAQLLMLSGIGPSEHLRNIGIPVTQNLPVGYNLMDHIAAGGLTFVTRPQNISLSLSFLVARPDLIFEWLRNHQGILTIPGGCEAVTFIDLANPKAADGWADMELLFIGASLNNDQTLRRNFNFDDNMYNQVFGNLGNKQTYMVFPMVMRPKSKGRIMLKNKNPRSHPLIYPNYFNDKEDVRVVVEGIKAAIKINEQPALKKLGAKLYDIPLPICLKQGPFGSDEYWACYAKHFTFTIYHQSGTCKMGPIGDPSAVVDPRLQVYGINNLRVADASIMPQVPSGHTNAPTYMIAEKAADMIKEDWGIYRK